MGLIAWFKSLFGKANTFLKQVWVILAPFLKEILDKSAQAAIDALKDLAVQAIQEIMAKGLPTDDAKRKAFADYMTAAAKQKGIQLGDYEMNLLREIALGIVKKMQEKKE